MTGRCVRSPSLAGCSVIWLSMGVRWQKDFCENVNRDNKTAMEVFRESSAWSMSTNSIRLVYPPNSSGWRSNQEHSPERCFLMPMPSQSNDYLSMPQKLFGFFLLSSGMRSTTLAYTKYHFN